MKLRPEGQKVLVEVDKVKEATSGGIWIPQTAKDNRQYMLTIGTVIAVGPTTILNFECKDDETPDEAYGNTRGLKIGDKIWFAKYGGASFEYLKKDERGRDLRIINDADVMAIVDDDDSDEKEVV